MTLRRARRRARRPTAADVEDLFAPTAASVEDLFAPSRAPPPLSKTCSPPPAPPPRSTTTRRRRPPPTALRTWRASAARGGCSTRLRRRRRRRRRGGGGGRRGAAARGGGGARLSAAEGTELRALLRALAKVGAAGRALDFCGTRFVLRVLVAQLQKGAEGAAAGLAPVSSADVAWATQADCHGTMLELCVSLAGGRTDWPTLRALGGFCSAPATLARQSRRRRRRASTQPRPTRGGLVLPGAR